MIITVLVILSIMVILLSWMILLDIKRGRETKAKLDGLDRIVKRIEEKTEEQIKEVYQRLRK